MHRCLALVLLVLLLPAAASAQTLDEYVVLAQGDTLRGDVDIKEPFIGSARIVVNDSAEYALGEVDEVHNASGNYVVGRGSAFGGPMLARRVESGRMTLYERITNSPGTWMPGPNGVQTYTGGGQTRSQFFRVAGGEVQKASPSNLRAAMQDSPAALAILERRDRLGYVQWGLVGVGAAVAILGATQSDFAEPDDGNPFTEEEGGASISPLLFVGVGVMAGSWIPHLMREPLLEESIDVYNRQP